MKFVVQGVQFPKPLSFPNAATAASHPLATRLFALAGVYNVFMVQDFVTVNKLPEVTWASLTPQIVQEIVSYLAMSASAEGNERL